MSAYYDERRFPKHIWQNIALCPIHIVVAAVAIVCSDTWYGEIYPKNLSIKNRAGNTNAAFR